MPPCARKEMFAGSLALDESATVPIIEIASAGGLPEILAPKLERHPFHPQLIGRGNIIS
jgi:hypothetical protein